MQPPLLLLLLRASRGLDQQLLDALVERGWPRLSSAQSQLLGVLDPGGTAPAELARRLGTTRQATHDLVAGVARWGLLEVVADPARTRGRLVRLTDDGTRLVRDGRAVLAGLEAGLDPALLERLRTDLQHVLQHLADPGEPVGRDGDRAGDWAGDRAGAPTGDRAVD